MKRTIICNLTLAVVLALGAAGSGWADGGDDGSRGGDGSASGSGTSGQVQSGDDKGGQSTQPIDNTGGDSAKPADDHGNHIEPGDDHGNHVEPGDDKGGTQNSTSGNGDSSDFRVRRKLVPVLGSPVMDASGHVVIRAQGTRQRFQVEAEAIAPDGTVFLVFADGNLAGSVTIQMGEGELELDTEDGDLPEGLNPVTSIKMVTVTDASGAVILQGRV